MSIDRRMAGLEYIHIMEYFVMVKANDIKPKISTRMHLANDVRGKSRRQKNRYFILQKNRYSQIIDSSIEFKNIHYCFRVHTFVW